MSIAKMFSYNYEKLYEEENSVRETLADILKFPMPSQALVVCGVFVLIRFVFSVHTAHFTYFYMQHIYINTCIYVVISELHKAAHVV